MGDPANPGHYAIVSAKCSRGLQRDNSLDLCTYCLYRITEQHCLFAEDPVTALHVDLHRFYGFLYAHAYQYMRSPITIFSKNFQSAIVPFVSFFRPPGPALAFFPAYLVCRLAVTISAISTLVNAASVCRESLRIRSIALAPVFEGVSIVAFV